MSLIDWAGLLRAGVQGVGHGLGLSPDAFWRLTPIDLRIMLGADNAVTPLTRARLADLAAAFPDAGKGENHGGHQRT